LPDSRLSSSMKRESSRRLVKLLPRTTSFPVKFQGFTFLRIEDIPDFSQEKSLGEHPTHSQGDFPTTFTGG
jgi:hypothetical protein